MDWLRQYSANIATVLIFSTFLGLVLPGGSYKGYIKLVTGLLVILAIISPLTKALNSDGYEALLKQAESELNMNIAGKESKYYYDDAMAETVIEVYREGIISGVSKKVQTCGYSLIHANIYIDESDENFGQITGMELTLSNPETVKTESTGFIKVDKIYLEPIGKQNANNINEESKEISAVKNLISDFYNLSADNIYIKIE